MSATLIILALGAMMMFIGGVRLRRETLKNLPRYANQNILCIIPVSYTHLDVYKRQVLHCKGCCGLV